ncbi:hypothetical protein ACLGBF_07950 [Helicobacter pylori]
MKEWKELNEPTFSETELKDIKEKLTADYDMTLGKNLKAIAEKN